MIKIKNLQKRKKEEKKNLASAEKNLVVLCFV